MDITHIKQTPSWISFVYQFYTTTLGLIMFQITGNRFQQWLAIWPKNNPDAAYLYKLIIQLISLCDNILNIFKEFRCISLQLRGHHKSEAMTGRKKRVQFQVTSSNVILARIWMKFQTISISAIVSQASHHMKLIHTVGYSRHVNQGPRWATAMPELQQIPTLK